jgi:predicted transposase/invertase (TIGR01784 family)
MPKNKISPHDRFIRSMMANPKVVQEFFETNLPDHVKKVIDMNSIKPQKDSFVADNLRLQVADMLFQVDVNGQTGFLYLLMEHQSKPDKMLPLRLIKYMISIQEQHLKKHKKDPLPFVFPMVIYTGNKPYNYSLDFFDLFGDNKDITQQTWTHPFHLIDLTQVSDEELRQYQFFGTMCLIAKHIHDPNFLPFLKILVDIFKMLESQGEESYIITSISYIIEAGEVPDKEAFIKTLTKGLETIDEGKIMTIAEMLKEDVFKSGMQQGMQQVALNMIAEGMPMQKIASLTGLDEVELKKLHKTLH